MYSTAGVLESNLSLVLGVIVPVLAVWALLCYGSVSVSSHFVFSGVELTRIISVPSIGSADSRGPTHQPSVGRTDRGPAPKPSHPSCVPSDKKACIATTENICVRDQDKSAQIMEEYRQAARQCLRDKTVMIMGNSVSRHWMFAFRELLKDSGPMTSVNRTQEMLTCGRGGEHAGEIPGQGKCWGACGCSMKAGGTRLEFIWQQRLFDTNMSKTILKFKPDLLTVSAGGDDIFQGYRKPEWKQWRKVVTKIAEVGGTGLNAMFKKLRHDLPDMRAYWRLTTPLCIAGNFTRCMGSAKPYYLNSMINVSNAHTRRHLNTAPVTILDFWDQNVNCCENYVEYDDCIHHGGLVELHVSKLISHYCGWKGWPWFHS